LIRSSLSTSIPNGNDGLFKKVADNGANMVKGWNSLGCLDHTIERSVLKLWNDAQVKESFGRKVKRLRRFSSLPPLGAVSLQKYRKTCTGTNWEC
jgi:hypothetical protein